VIGIGGGDHKLPPAETKQIVFPHDAAHPLVVDLPAAPFQFRRDPGPTVARKFQGDPLDVVPQIEVLVHPLLFRFEPVQAGSAHPAQLTHSGNAHRAAFLDFTFDLPAGRGLPVCACSIRASSIRCKQPFKKSISSACCPTLRSS